MHDFSIDFFPAKNTTFNSVNLGLRDRCFFCHVTDAFSARIVLEAVDNKIRTRFSPVALKQARYTALSSDTV